MVKFSDIVKKGLRDSANRNSTEYTPLPKRKSNPRSNTLKNLFTYSEKKENVEKTVKYSNTLGDLFGVEKPINL